MYILAAVVSSGIIFGCLFKPLKTENKREKTKDLNENINKAFDLGLDNKDIPDAQKSESKEDLVDDIKSYMGAHLSIFKSLPMALVMVSHLLLNLGTIKKGHLAQICI